jgi:hypothetical protein
LRECVAAKHNDKNPTSVVLADKSYAFVETADSHNGYDKWSNFFRSGTKLASSVKDLVNQIVADLQPEDCIKKLTIIGPTRAWADIPSAHVLADVRNDEIAGTNQGRY